MFQRETIYTPQGDEYQSGKSSHSLIPFETIYTPQGDEYLPRSISAATVLMETIYTPQGDEYISLLENRYLRLRNNLHLARGRIQEKIVLLEVVVEKQSTPRKGTNTASCSRQGSR